jgi:hypothetical protein
VHTHCASTHCAPTVHPLCTHPPASLAQAIPACGRGRHSAVRIRYCAPPTLPQHAPPMTCVPTGWQLGSNGHMIVGRIQAKQVTTVSASKTSIVSQCKHDKHCKSVQARQALYGLTLFNTLTAICYTDCTDCTNCSHHDCGLLPTSSATVSSIAL